MGKCSKRKSEGRREEQGVNLIGIRRMTERRKKIEKVHR